MDRDGVIEPLYELDFDEQRRDPRAPRPEADCLDDIALVEACEYPGAAPPAIAGAIEIDPVHPLRRLGSWVSPSRSSPLTSAGRPRRESCR
ncbi:MAG TPA: hypothetical protein VMJ10_15390 [Kofleriaceae bacterium]|nr:hypothetical protein [Kofleriaceae bacterium]